MFNFFKKNEESDTAEYYYKVGKAHHGKKEYSLAEIAYKKAIGLGNVDATFWLGDLYFSQKRYEEAEKYSLKAVELGKTEALINLGVIYENKQGLRQNIAPKKNILVRLAN